MNPILYIRKHVFQLKQAEFAKMVGVGQGSVSRWEHGGTLTNEDMAVIRNEAKKRELGWTDDWFYEAPAQALPAADQDHRASV